MGTTQRTIPETEWDRTIAALKDANGNQTQAALSLGLARSTLQNRIALARAQGRLPDSTSLEGFQVKKVSTYYGRDGERTGAWVQEVLDTPSVEAIASQVREALETYKPPAVLKSALKPPPTESDLATLYPLVDVHVGLRSWSLETGVNYDLEIGRETLYSSMTRLFAASPKSKQAVILGLGDLLHSDNYDNQTSRSKNTLDVDGRYPKVLTEATHSVIFCTDLALKIHEAVEIVILPGNHDEQSAIAVALALTLYYANNPRVKVHDGVGRFWWWEWGLVFLGATHGDKAKMKDLPLIMAARNPEEWGKTKFRQIFTGHTHHERLLEMNGVIVESLQSPVAIDAWHHSMGYGAGRSVQSRTYHKTAGEISRNRVNIV